MRSEALNAARSASTANYQSFAEATRCVLDLVERHFGDVTPFLAHLDHNRDLHRIVDVRRGEAFGLRANVTHSLGNSFCAHMAEGRAPRLSNDVGTNPAFTHLRMPTAHKVGAYLGVPLELSDGAKVASLVALSPQPDRFDSSDEELFALLAVVLSRGLERESEQQDLQRLSGTLRDQARGMASVEVVARTLAKGEDAREEMCQAACEIASAPVAFLLEPTSDRFTSTASAGTVMEAVTIHPREGGSLRNLFSTETLLVSDVQGHSALAPALVERLKARSALFEPILRENNVVGVLILIWRERVTQLAESTSSLLNVLSAQAGAVIEHSNLRSRVGELALTDHLTGVPTARAWDEEIRREVARAQRNETPLSLGLIELDELRELVSNYGSAEGDLVIKEAVAAWSDRIRTVDYLARIDEGRFALLLPNCPLSEACNVFDRLREVTPRDRTATAAVARWNEEEPVEFLVQRCEAALEAGMADGGDTTIVGE